MISTCNKLCLIAILSLPCFAGSAFTADSFIDSIGVATHWTYPSYSANFAALEEMLGASGIRHIRDGAVPGVMQDLRRFGISETVVIYPPGGLVPNKSYWSGVGPDGTYTVDDYLQNRMPEGSVDALEMPNELDIFYGLYKWHPGDKETLSADPSSANYYGKYGEAVTRDSWRAMKGTKIRIIGPTVGAQVPSPFTAGSLYKYVDYGGFHPYPGRANTWTYPQPYGTIAKYYWNSFEPSVNVGSDEYGGNPLMFTWYQPPFTAGSGSKAMIATESGYVTGVPGGISVLAQAKYVPRMFAEYFRNGIVRTFNYELFDEGPLGPDPVQNAGLVFNDLSPKPAFTALSSLISVLQDRTAKFLPGALAYSLAVQPSGDYTRTGYVHDLLLQKSTGDFFLLLWHEISDSSNTDVAGNQIAGVQRDIIPPALPVTVALPSEITSAVLYAYNVAWVLTPKALTITNNSVSLRASDTISVLQLSSRKAP